MWGSSAPAAPAAEDSAPAKTKSEDFKVTIEVKVSDTAKEQPPTDRKGSDDSEEGTFAKI